MSTGIKPETLVFAGHGPAIKITGASSNARVTVLSSPRSKTKTVTLGRTTKVKFAA